MTVLSFWYWNTTIWCLFWLVNPSYVWNFTGPMIPVQLPDARVSRIFLRSPPAFWTTSPMIIIDSYAVAAW